MNISTFHYVCFVFSVLSVSSCTYVMWSIKRAPRSRFFHRFVIWICFADCITSGVLVFQLWPSFIEDLPKKILQKYSEKGSFWFMATPELFQGWDAVVWMLFFAQFCCFLASWGYWFVIAYYLSIFMKRPDFFNYASHTEQPMTQEHLYVWGVSLFIGLVFQVLPKIYLDSYRYEDTDMAWIMVGAEKALMFRILFGVLICLMIFGTYLVVSAVHEFGLHLISRRVTIFVGGFFIVWLPAIVFIMTEVQYTIVSLSCCGFVDACVWMFSNHFTHICFRQSNVFTRTASGTMTWLLGPDSSSSSFQVNSNGLTGTNDYCHSRPMFDTNDSAV